MADILVTHDRHFIMIYDDFWDIDPKILSYYDKITFVAIKRYANDVNEAYPSISKLAKVTGMSESQLKRSKKKLTELGFLQVTQRKRKGYNEFTSNEYHLYDTERMCKGKTPEEIKEAATKSERDYWADRFRREGWTPPDLDGHKKRASAVGADESSQLDTISCTDNNTKYNGHQEELEEKYPYDYVLAQYEYDVLVNDAPQDTGLIDNIMSILHETLNRQRDYIKIGDETKPKGVVIQRLLKLDCFMIKAVITKFKEESEVTKIRNIKQYLLTMLYNEPSTHNASVTASYRYNTFNQ